MIKQAHNKHVVEVRNGISAADPPSSQNSGVKRAWSYLKLLRTESVGMPTLFSDGRVCVSDVAKAEALRSQYDSVFTREDLSDTPVLADSPYPDLPEISFSMNGARKLLENVQVHKAHGPDSIPARILKEVASELAPILTLLFNQSLDTGISPSAWKDANIAAIFKKGS